MIRRLLVFGCVGLIYLPGLLACRPPPPLPGTTPTREVVAETATGDVAMRRFDGLRRSGDTLEPVTADSAASAAWDQLPVAHRVFAVKVKSGLAGGNAKVWLWRTDASAGSPGSLELTGARRDQGDVVRVTFRDPSREAPFLAWSTGVSSPASSLVLHRHDDGVAIDVNDSAASPIALVFAGAEPVTYAIFLQPSATR